MTMIKDYWKLLTYDDNIAQGIFTWVLGLSQNNQSKILEFFDPNPVSIKIKPDWICIYPHLYTGFIKTWLKSEPNTTSLCCFYNYTVPYSVELSKTWEKILVFRFKDHNPIFLNYETGNIESEVFDGERTKLTSGLGPLNYSELIKSNSVFPNFINEWYRYDKKYFGIFL